MWDKIWPRKRFSPDGAARFSRMALSSVLMQLRATIEKKVTPETPWMA
jgi:hypothetical protein